MPEFSAIREVLDDFDAGEIDVATALARVRVVTLPERMLIHNSDISWLHGDSSIPVGYGIYESEEERAVRIKERRDEAIKFVSMSPGQVETLRKAQRSARYWVTGRTREGRGQLRFLDRVREQVGYWLAWWAYSDERQDFYKKGKP